MHNFSYSQKLNALSLWHHIIPTSLLTKVTFVKYKCTSVKIIWLPSSASSGSQLQLQPRFVHLLYLMQEIQSLAAAKQSYSSRKAQESGRSYYWHRTVTWTTWKTCPITVKQCMKLIKRRPSLHQRKLLLGRVLLLAAMVTNVISRLLPFSLTCFLIQTPRTSTSRDICCWNSDKPH